MMIRRSLKPEQPQKSSTRLNNHRGNSYNASNGVCFKNTALEYDSRSPNEEKNKEARKITYLLFTSHHNQACKKQPYVRLYFAEKCEMYADLWHSVRLSGAEF
jgi:hypothetical protein